ncbi:MAG: spermidine/putrescine ABC transporter substrate-binding protein [Oscillospiraceae bacterium]|jgi:spermidine/putrescine transport system substrate-binding protein|nr:spermidine/putrescine ABC transporter substrate-binding protein [Oscillospiraceae bacterium]
MKKLPVLAIALALLAALLSSCGGGGPKNLNIFTWEGMFPPEILESFEKESGIKINYLNFDYDETMLAKLEAANGGDYDLVIADDYIIETAIQENLVKKLDKSKIANYGNINPVYQGQFYDPDDVYTVPYGAGVQTIVYDPGKVGFEIRAYADLWDASLSKSVGVIGNYRVINGMALKVLGESYNTNDPDAIGRAGAKLNELAPNIRLIKDDGLDNDIVSGEVSAAVMYTSQVTLAKLARPELKVVYPAEGIGFGIMGAFIPDKAPNPDAAYQFLNYILDAQRGAQCFEYLGYYSTNKAADEYISEELREFLIIPEEFTSNMEMIQNIEAEAESEHGLIWTEFRTLCGQ